MKRLLWVLMSLLYMSMMESCQYDNIKHKLSQMYGSKIDLSVSEMMIVMPDETYADRLNTEGMKLVVYSDTSDCSQCYINHLNSWNEMLAQEDSFPHFSLVFIIEACDGECNTLKRLLEQSGLRHSVFIDVNSSFRRKNPHLPKESFFHTFLINEKNEVCLVGDPLRNEAIEKMLRDALHEKDHP